MIVTSGVPVMTDIQRHVCTYCTPGNLAVGAVPVMVVVKTAIVDHGRDVGMLVLVQAEEGEEGGGGREGGGGEGGGGRGGRERRGRRERRDICSKLVQTLQQQTKATQHKVCYQTKPSLAN